MLLTTGVEMTQPVLTKILVDRVIPNANFTLFGWIVAGIAAIHVFGSVFSGTRSYLMGWLGQKAVHDLRERVHAHLQTLSLDFYDQRQTGWIMDRVGNDTTNLQRFLSEIGRASCRERV
jgi:ATP-binding cassette, subfamily B, bacterial